MKDSKNLLLLLKKGKSDSGLEMSADNTESIMTVFLQIALAILIPFMMIAITHQEKFKTFVEAAKNKMAETEERYKYLKGSNVEIEYNERVAKAEEVQWLEIFKALDAIESEVRNNMYLNIFVKTTDGKPSVVRDNVNVMSGTKIADNYFVLSCKAALETLTYGRHATRKPADMEYKWFYEAIKRAKLTVEKDANGREKEVTANDLIDNPNAITTSNKGKLIKEVKQKVNLLYEDTCMFQSKVLEQMWVYCRENPVRGSKFFKTAEDFWKVGEEEQDGLLAKLFSELDEYTKSVLKKQKVELLPEVWQRGM